MGAAIAAGNQAEKGICALLVNLAILIKPQSHGHREKLDCNTLITWEVPSIIAIAIETMMRMSPTRFLKIVKVPALADLALW